MSEMVTMARQGVHRVRRMQRATTLRKAWGWTHLALGTAWTVVSLDPQQFDVRESLPLHLCDVLCPVMALGLITGNERALALTYYWGILLNPQAIITPDVIYYFEPRALRFATYWFLNHAPGSPSAITLLGPWPAYIGAETVGVAGAWAALTAAWR